MLRRLSNLNRHQQLELLKAKRMSSMEKIQKTSKKTVKKSPVIVEDESNDECVMKPVRSSSKSKPKSLERAKNPFIDYEILENSLEERDELESGGEQEKDYVSGDVKEPKETETKLKKTRFIYWLNNEKRKDEKNKKNKKNKKKPAEEKKMWNERKQR